MGQAWYCRKCEEGKINLSNACAERFVNEETGAEYTLDERAMNRLQCLDERHSARHGLTIENFESLVQSVEKQLGANVKDVPCQLREAMIDCLRKHPDCMSKCFQEMNEFISCVDAARINIIKQKIAKARQEINKQKPMGIFGVDVE